MNRKFRFNFFAIGNSTIEQIVEKVVEERQYHTSNEEERAKLKHDDFDLIMKKVKGLSPTGAGYEGLWFVRVNKVVYDCFSDYISNARSNIMKLNCADRRVKEWNKLEKEIEEISTDYKNKAENLFTDYLTSSIIEDLCHSSMSYEHKQGNLNKMTRKDFFLDIARLKPRVLASR